MEDHTALYHPGQIVVALTGREMGRSFVVVGTEQQRLLLADGGKRSVSRPKRKNPRHVRLLAGQREEFAVTAGSPLTDAMVRQLLHGAEEEG